jgi:hypothetical protein
VDTRHRADEKDKAHAAAIVVCQDIATGYWISGIGA